MVTYNTRAWCFKWLANLEIRYKARKLCKLFAKTGFAAFGKGVQVKVNVKHHFLNNASISKITNQRMLTSTSSNALPGRVSEKAFNE